MWYGRIAVVLVLAALGACGEGATRPDSPGRRWVLADGGIGLVGGATGGHTVWLALPGWHWAGEPYSCAPGLAIGPVGEAVVTSDVVPVLWRVDPLTHAVTTHEPALDADADKDVGFTGLVYSPAHNAYYGVTYAGAVWRIDALLRRAQKMDLDSPVRRACGIALGAESLCVLAETGFVAVVPAPDQRSGHVRATPPCVPLGAEAARGSGRSRAP